MRSSWFKPIITTVGVLAALCLGVLMTPVGCYYFETRTSAYSTPTEAQRLFAEGNFVASDMPNFLVPASAERIRFTYNIDTNQWWFTFRFALTDSLALLAGRRTLSAAEAREVEYFTPFWFRGWPTTLNPELAPLAPPVYVAQSEFPNGCLAIDWPRHTAFAWLCRHRAT